MKFYVYFMLIIFKILFSSDFRSASMLDDSSRRDLNAKIGDPPLLIVQIQIIAVGDTKETGLPEGSSQIFLTPLTDLVSATPN